MRKFLTTYVSALALLSSPALAVAGQPQMAVFAFDMSNSAAIAIDTNAARSAGNYVQSFIKGMRPGDTLKVRTLGTAGVTAQQIYLNVKFGKKSNARPRRIAPQVGKLIRSLPQRVKRGEINIQSRTNIIGFFETLGPSLDCQKVSTTIVIFSDGIEWSTRIRGDELLSGKKELPAPSEPFLKGCNIELRGLGQQNNAMGTDSRWFQVLKTQWIKFFKAAGASHFAAYAEFE